MAVKLRQLDQQQIAKPRVLCIDAIELSFPLQLGVTDIAEKATFPRYCMYDTLYYLTTNLLGG